MRPTLFTSANLTYLPQALVLLESLRISNPAARLVLVLVDEEPEDDVTVERLETFDDVVVARDLFGEGFEQWIFGHDVVEACTAIKGCALRRLLGPGDVVYLDPDLAVLGPLDDFFDLLAGSSVLLTPHLLGPVAADSVHVGDEITTLQHGLYNFGMFGVASTPEGREFADWWGDRLRTRCIDDVLNGLFTDQRWGDLVPSFFPSSSICRDPGVNVASWNLHQRPLTMSSTGEYRVDGHRLVSFHFTKALGIGFEVSRMKMVENPLVADLWRWYLERLEHHSAGLPQHRWAYADSSDGVPIPLERRRGFRRLWGDDGLPDPFRLRSDDPWWAVIDG